MKDEHRLLVQTFLSKGLISERELREIYREVNMRCNVHEPIVLDQFINTINAGLGTVAMEIRHKKDEDTGEEMYALVQTVESDLGKLTTDYQPTQLELFKKIVGLIVGSPEGVASSIDILNLADSLEKRMSKNEAELSLGQFVKEKWLKESEGDVCLTARAIMELEDYLHQTYDPIDQCAMCKETAIKGQPCSQCGIKLHRRCARILFRDAVRACPNCKQTWQHAENGIHANEDRPSTSSGAHGSRGNRSRRVRPV